MKVQGNLIIVLLLLTSCVFQSYAQSKNPDWHISEFGDTLPDDFPYDYVVEEFWINCSKGKYVFKKDNSFLFIYGCNGDSEDYDFGNWILAGDSIIIETHLSFGLRPAGEPLNPEMYGAAVPEEYLKYETYVNYEYWEDKHTVLNINDFFYEKFVIEEELKASDINIDTTDYLLNGKYKEASCRILKEADLIGLSKKELRLMRNEIFARYGYQFNAEDLKRHFSETDWYQPRFENVDEYLTETEHANIKLIQEFERK